MRYFRLHQPFPDYGQAHQLVERMGAERRIAQRHGNAASKQQDGERQQAGTLVAPYPDAQHCPGKPRKLGGLVQEIGEFRNDEDEQGRHGEHPAEHQNRRVDQRPLQLGAGSPFVFHLRGTVPQGSCEVSGHLAGRHQLIYIARQVEAGALQHHGKGLPLAQTIGHRLQGGNQLRVARASLLGLHRVGHAHSRREHGGQLVDGHVQFLGLEPTSRAQVAAFHLQAERGEPLALQLPQRILARGEAEFATNAPALAIDGLVDEIHGLSRWSRDAPRQDWSYPTRP